MYTDGSCHGNPGPGGWGAILRWEGRERELSGGAAETTNKQMELMAVIEGLKALLARVLAFHGPAVVVGGGSVAQVLGGVVFFPGV